MPSRGERVSITPLSKLQIEGVHCHVTKWHSGIDALAAKLQADVLPAKVRISALDLITKDITSSSAEVIGHDMHSVFSMYPLLQTWDAPGCPLGIGKTLLDVMESLP